MSTASISPQELKDRHQAPDFCLIDVRTPLEFSAFRATTARNYPLATLDPATVAQSLNRTVHDTLYVICKSGKRGEMACRKFQEAGFTNVVNVSGGTEAWHMAGLPTQRSASQFTLSLEQQVRVVIGGIVAAGAFAAFFSSWLTAIPLIMGLGLVFAGITDSCLMAMLVSRMPWNREVKPRTTCSIHPNHQLCE